jgi:hypothetical protein
MGVQPHNWGVPRPNLSGRETSFPDPTNPTRALMPTSTSTRNSSPPASALVWTPFLLLCLIAAAAAIRRIAVLVLPPTAAGPPQLQGLDATFAARNVLTLAHIVPALAFILILPAWFSRRVRANAAIHRRITLLLLAIGAIIGLTALALSTNPVGGLTEQSATLLYDAIFLFSLTRAAVAFLAHNQQIHRIWMMRAIAVLLGIAATRPVMGVFFATASRTHLTPHQFFGIAFWIGFTSTFLAGELYLRKHRV